MKLTPKIKKAINFASRLHLGQDRKSDPDIPFIVHPFCVAWILADYTDDEDVITAGILHDVLEDVKGYKFEDMEKEFGTKIAKIVKEVSEDKDPNDIEDPKATWQKRKQKYIDNLKNDSREALMVAAADKIHNLQSMIDAYKKHGEKMWAVFNSPPDKKLWFYEEVLKILKRRLHNRMVKELEQIYLEAQNLIKPSKKSPPIF